MLIVISANCALNVVVQSIIQPRFIGDAVGLSVTVTFVHWRSGRGYSARSGHPRHPGGYRTLAPGFSRVT